MELVMKESLQRNSVTTLFGFLNTNCSKKSIIILFPQGLKKNKELGGSNWVTLMSNLFILD